MNIDELLHDFIEFCLSVKDRKFVKNEINNNDISLLVNNFENKAIEQSISIDDIKQIQYVIIALIDELICENYPELKAQWSADSLQVKNYHHHIAGELFFVKLETILKNDRNNTNLLKVFLVCLLLGFKGRYQQQPQKLREYQHSIIAIIEKNQSKNILCKQKKSIKLYRLIIIVLSLTLTIYVSSMLWFAFSSHSFMQHLNEIKEAYDVSHQQNVSPY